MRPSHCQRFSTMCSLFSISLKTRREEGSTTLSSRRTKMPDQTYEIYIEKTICYRTWVRAASPEEADEKASIIEDRTTFSDYSLRGTDGVSVTLADEDE